ncbi:hypothetical protein [Streptomyces iconiensis]|uniref:Uncharacterized protein n=1 Tax=Streptomyces iconiensis TaxID=1384038 RepID=A0ABT6ZZ44_9ACTN|nr:hypothetical protein [Streptomyces iconiensis]MDJ1134311.1 hypothetical protein [Streptomyces iconiensis]
MRLRHTVAAGLGALTLALTVPASAGATSGQFSYLYETHSGPEPYTLVDPPSHECLTLPQAADPHSQPPAHSPRNRTASRAVVYDGPDCTGQSFALRAHTGYGTERLKVRSVYFE